MISFNINYPFLLEFLFNHVQPEVSKLDNSSFLLLIKINLLNFQISCQRIFIVQPKEIDCTNILPSTQFLVSVRARTTFELTSEAAWRDNRDQPDQFIYLTKQLLWVVCGPLCVGSRTATQFRPNYGMESDCRLGDTTAHFMCSS